ncbi:glycosyltransferase [Nonomuraea ferruginea]
MLFATGVLTLARLLLLVVLARVHARRSRGPGPALTWERPPGVSVIVPAYNEEAGIAATVRSLVATAYPGPVEVLVVDDGSTDRTAEAAAGPRLPGVRVIRQDNAGKAAALNTGIRHARHEFLVMVDGDTVFEPDTIGHLVRRLADPRVGAVSGNTKVGNRRGLIGRWQHVEYVIGFNLDRRAFELLDCMPTVPGAIGAFRRGALVGLGGVSTDTLAEDTDLTMALCRAGWRVVYEERALAWTEAPATLGQLWRQRYRWCYGTMQAMWKHRRALAEPGPFGRRCLGYLALFHVLLPLLAPVVDLMAVYHTAVGDPLLGGGGVGRVRGGAGGGGLVRAAAGPGAGVGAVGAAAAAVGVPAADVSGGVPVGGDRAARGAAALAHGAQAGHFRGAVTAPAGDFTRRPDSLTYKGFRGCYPGSEPPNRICHTCNIFFVCIYTFCVFAVIPQLCCRID